MAERMLEFAWVVLTALGGAVVIVFPEEGTAPARVRVAMKRLMRRAGLAAWVGAWDCYLCASVWIGTALGAMAALWWGWAGHLSAGLAAAAIAWAVWARTGSGASGGGGGASEEGGQV